jgi:hypothetical protein
MATVKEHRAALGAQKMSAKDIENLLKLKHGVGMLTATEAKRYIELGWVETKFGGYVLTAVGRYQIDVRAREKGAALLANRWRRRAEELRTIADSMTHGDTGNLVDIATQWEYIAEQLLKIEALEKRERNLT